MKLLITGGSGTLGREITKLAIANNHQVNILTRNKKLVSNNTTSHKTSIKTSKQDFPTGLKHIRNSELEEEETNQDNLSNKT